MGHFYRTSDWLESSKEILARTVLNYRAPLITP